MIELTTLEVKSQSLCDVNCSRPRVIGISFIQLIDLCSFSKGGGLLHCED